MSRTILSLLALALAAAGCGPQVPPSGEAARFENFRGGKDAPTYRAALVAAAPVVDGRMDAAYRQAEPIRFVFINGERRRPSAATEARVVCTRDALYVFWRCRCLGPEGFRCARKGHDAPLWHDNSVELFLDPTATAGPGYYQVIVNAAGSVADLRARDLKAWDPRLTAATATDGGAWTAELAVPFAELGLAPGSINKVWRMNLTRFSTSPPEDTSWCVLGDFSSHTPSRFGYLWVDAGDVLNVPAREMVPWEPIFNGRDLSGWRLQRGRAAVRGGMITVRPAEEAVIVRTEPLPYDDVVISAEVVSDRQFRFCFARDPDNARTGFYATFINHINESNVALMRDWEYWAPPMGGHLTIPHYGPCPMGDNIFYRLRVRFRPRRVTLMLDDRILMEAANLYPDARRLGLHLIGGCKVRDLRIRRLVAEE